MSVNHSARSGDIIGISFRFSLRYEGMLCVLIRIASSHTQHTIFNIKRKITLNYPKSAGMGFFKGLKNEFERAVVDEPSVFEPLKFYCIG